jgi:hypothetical protein
MLSIAYRYLQLPVHDEFYREDGANLMSLVSFTSIYPIHVLCIYPVRPIGLLTVMLKHMILLFETSYDRSTTVQFSVTLL